MTYEVELKYRVDDLAAFTARVDQLGVAWGEPVEQVDHYFNHPAKDFVQTDEALRLRRVGERNRITYKGPKLDAATKTRREIELPLADGTDSEADWTAMLEALGFRPVAKVTKTRRAAAISWQNQEVELCLDEVQDVGTYVELELVADEQSLDAARACVQSLAAELGLSESERRSYLELLLAGESA